MIHYGSLRRANQKGSVLASGKYVAVRNAEERCHVNCVRTKSPVHLECCKWRRQDPFEHAVGWHREWIRFYRLNVAEHRRKRQRIDNNQFARIMVPNRFGYENNAVSLSMMIVSLSRRVPFLSVSGTATACSACPPLLAPCGRQYDPWPVSAHIGGANANSGFPFTAIPSCKSSHLRHRERV